MYFTRCMLMKSKVKMKLWMCLQSEKCGSAFFGSVSKSLKQLQNILWVTAMSHLCVWEQRYPVTVRQFGLLISCFNLWALSCDFLKLSKSNSLKIRGPEIKSSAKDKVPRDSNHCSQHPVTEPKKCSHFRFLYLLIIILVIITIII